MDMYDPDVQETPTETNFPTQDTVKKPPYMLIGGILVAFVAASSLIISVIALLRHDDTRSIVSDNHSVEGDFRVSGVSTFTNDINMTAVSENVNSATAPKLTGVDAEFSGVLTLQNGFTAGTTVVTNAELQNLSRHLKQYYGNFSTTTAQVIAATTNNVTVSTQTTILISGNISLSTNANYFMDFTGYSGRWLMTGFAAFNVVSGSTPSTGEAIAGVFMSPSSVAVARPTDTLNHAGCSVTDSLNLSVTAIQWMPFSQVIDLQGAHANMPYVYFGYSNTSAAILNLSNIQVNMIQIH
jgi:hypothetical protein